MTPFETAPSEPEADSLAGRLLRDALDRLRAGDTGGARALAADAVRALEDTAATLVVDDDATGFRLGPIVASLARKGSMRRVFSALVAAHPARRVLTAQELLAAGWPGETPAEAAGLLRVYTVVRRLRAAGLSDALQTVDDGYRIDPRLVLVRGR